MRPVSVILPFAVLGLLILAAVPASSDGASSASASAASSNPVAARSLPVAWIPNAGQHDSKVAFHGRAGNIEAWLTSEGAVLSMRDRRSERDPNLTGAALKLRFGNGSGAMRTEGISELPGRVSYIRGSESKGCFTDLPTYDAVSQKGGDRGIEVVWRDAGHRLSYDVIADAGAAIGGFTIDVDGANRIDVSPSGDLVIETAIGELRHAPPAAYAVDADGTQRDVAVTYRKIDVNRFGFDVKDLHSDEALSIRPVLSFVSYLGDVSLDAARAVATDAEGAAYLVGTCASSSYPATVGCFDAASEARGDAFVIKLASNGSSVVWCTVIGGKGHDEGTSLAVDASGRLFVGGTASGDFPNNAVTSGAGSAGTSDVWCARLSPKGTSLEWCLRFGGASDDVLGALCVDDSGALFAVGTTASTNFPVSPNAVQPNLAGKKDAFVVTLDDAAGMITSGTYIGGEGDDEGSALSIIGKGRIAIAGSTASRRFLDASSAAGGTDAFALVIDDIARPYVGSRFGGPADDAAYGVTVDASGRLLVSGRFGPGYPGSSGIDSGDDGFVACLTADARDRVWTTIIGGAGEDAVHSLLVDNSGTVWITGSSDSSSLSCGLAGAPESEIGSFLIALGDGGEVDDARKPRRIPGGPPHGLALNARSNSLHIAGDADRNDNGAPDDSKTTNVAVDLASCGTVTIDPAGSGGGTNR